LSSLLLAELFRFMQEHVASPFSISLCSLRQRVLMDEDDDGLKFNGGTHGVNFIDFLW
jgi:hypothetical protein